MHLKPAMATVTAMAPAEQSKQQLWDYRLRKYLLLLATIVATVTYSAGFTPPGGVWQETVEGRHRAGDAIIREIRYIRYVVFLYCNASAFASSLLVVVLILLLAVLHEKTDLWIKLLPLRVVMVLDLFSLIMAYAAGTCRDNFTKVYSCSLLVVSAVAYLILQVVLALWPPPSDDDSRAGKLRKGRSRKILLLLATFAVSLTYTAGLNTPGGFWDNPEDGNHRPGDAILKENHEARLMAFFVCNTTAFVASLFIILLLLDNKLHKTGPAACVLYGCIVAALLGLIGAYAAGSSRERATTTYVISLVAAVLFCILLLLHIAKRFGPSCEKAFVRLGKPQLTGSREEQLNDAVDKGRSLVLLLATLAATITYQAGLHPPGGVWQEDDKVGHHIAGDPILLTTKPRRYKAFFYCNSVAFVASLVVIVLVQNKLLLKHHVLEAAMVLDLFGLIGAYAAGACRDVSTSIYVVAMVGVVLVYVLLHVIYFLPHHMEPDGDEQVEKRRKRLLLFAILAATVSYQAGLTPPGGFHAGYPILLYNSARRYTVFFYCNSASFVLSMALNILLVNPNVYKPAIVSYALSVCTVVDLFGLVGAYAVGSTLRRSTSISIIVMAAVVLLVMLLLLIVSLVKGVKNDTAAAVATADAATPAATVATATTDAATPAAAATAVAPRIATEEDPKKKKHAKRKYLMLLGILVASVTYQVGLDQPGGVWQSNTAEHNAGNPVMRDNRGRRYHLFFYCNSTAFVASIIVIILLLLRVGGLHKKDWWLRVMNTTVLLDLLALLGAYVIGSSRDRKTSTYVAMLIVAVLAYVTVHVTLSFLCSDKSHQQGNAGDNPA